MLGGIIMAIGGAGLAFLLYAGSDFPGFKLLGRFGIPIEPARRSQLSSSFPASQSG